jgi:hypothetical protein
MNTPHPVPYVCIPLEYQEELLVRMRALARDMGYKADVSEDCVWSDFLYVCQMRYGILPPAPESEGL